MLPQLSFSATFACRVALLPVEIGWPLQVVFALVGSVQLINAMLDAAPALTTKFAEVPFIVPAVAFSCVLLDAL
jgi:hypothetical protein